MRSGMSALAVTLGLVLGAAGCTSSTGVNEVTTIGVIEELNTGEDAIVVPDVVQAGEEFEVTVTTSGRNSCVREDRTEVEVEGSSAEITPYDVTSERSDGGCAQVIVHLTRTETITFDEPGPALIVVYGRSFHDNDIHPHEFEVVVE